MDKQSRILISGAGLAGLTTTIWLGRAGFKPVVIEKSPDIRADGYMLTLSRHCYDLLADLGVLDDILAWNIGVHSSSYHDRNGKAILRLDYGRLFEAKNVVQIMRDDLEHVFYKHAQQYADFRFGNGVSAIEQTDEEVQVTFDDGSTEAFDLVIGADGLHSAVRQAAFSDEVITKHDLGLLVAAYRCENSLGMEHKYEAYLEPYRHSIAYTTRDNRLACIFKWTNSGKPIPRGNKERLDYLIDAFSGANQCVQRLFDARGEQDDIFMDTMTQIDMNSWHKGRVVLVGDAAHCLTTMSGQGASMSIAGASAFARALTETSLDNALRNYEQTIRPQINVLQPATRRNAKWYVPSNQFIFYLRDAALRFMPNEYWVNYFKRKYSEA